MTHRPNRRALTLTVIAVALAVALPASAAGPNDGLIVFETGRDGNSEIYSMRPDGSDQTRLTNNPAFDWQATLSPDGSKVAFGSLGTGTSRSM